MEESGRQVRRETDIVDALDDITTPSELGESGSFRVKKRPRQLTSDPLVMQLATLRDDLSRFVTISPEHLFGRHCTVLGSTGGGKSWSLARLIEQTARFNSKMILLDASGEFYAIQDDVRHLSVGSRSHEQETLVSVPYYHLREGDLFAIFKPSGPSQGPKMRAAIQSLKLARRAPLLSPDGTIFKAHRSKVDFERERQDFLAELEDPMCDFDIRKLPMQLQHECVDPQRSPTEPYVWGGPSGIDLSFCVPLVTRVQDMISSPNLRAVFQPGAEPSLFDEILRFLESDHQRVLRISLRDLPFEHHCREIIGNAIGRFLLDLARQDRFKKKPCVVAVDEAHQFLSKSVRAENEFFPLDSFGLIAKEGRKYALTLCLSTQRPRDIPEDILSQMGMFLVHRMTNQLDLGVVERASGTIDAHTLAAIPNLLPGEAILIGVHVPDPLTLRMIPPVQKPDSKGPNYQLYWR